MQMFISAFILIIIFILAGYVSARSESKKKQREYEKLNEIITKAVENGLRNYDHDVVE